MQISLRVTIFPSNSEASMYSKNTVAGDNRRVMFFKTIVMQMEAELERMKNYRGTTVPATAFKKSMLLLHNDKIKLT